METVSTYKPYRAENIPPIVILKYKTWKNKLKFSMFLIYIINKQKQDKYIMNSNKKQAKFKPDPELKLMDQVRQVLRYFHYAYRTEQSYCDWIVRYLKFNGG